MSTDSTTSGPVEPAESVNPVEPTESVAPGGSARAEEPAGPGEPAPAADPQPPRRTFVSAFVYALTSANTVMVTILAVLLALVVGAVLIVVSNQNLMPEYGYFFAAPGSVLADSWRVIAEAYGNLFKGAIFDPAAISSNATGAHYWTGVFAPISETLTYAAPLIFSGLAVALAFRGGLFNIGAQGQVALGAIGGALVGFEIHAPYGVHLILALIGSIVGGALWGVIAGYLKARTGAHEVIVTIMLNYVALRFLDWLIIQRGVQDPHRTDAISKKVAGTAKLPLIGGADLRMNLGIVLGVLAAAGVAWLLSRSTVGFELRAVGANPDAARTAGIGVGRTYILAMLLSGGLAGLAGGTQVLGTAYSLTSQVGGSIGFDGITVALLGRSKPWGVVASALLFGAFHAGGNRMQSFSHISIDLVTVVQALIVIFIAAPALVKAVFRLRAQRASRSSTNLAKGW